MKSNLSRDQFKSKQSTRTEPMKTAIKSEQLQSGRFQSSLAGSLCLILTLTICNWSSESSFGVGQQLVRGLFGKADATLWPRTRICFNSMTSTFQSECVYCDTRLYAGTIAACTGQPVLATNITQAQAFCIATACLQQTGKQPTVLGKRRKRRSLPFGPLALNSNKARPLSLGPNGNMTAQFANSPNGTMSGNLGFVLNRPAQALWLSPLSRALLRNNNGPNKSFQWQFGKAPQLSAAATAPGVTVTNNRPAASGSGTAQAPARQPNTTVRPAAVTSRPPAAAPSGRLR